MNVFTAETGGNFLIYCMKIDEIFLLQKLYRKFSSIKIDEMITVEIVGKFSSIKIDEFFTAETVGVIFIYKYR